MPLQSLVAAVRSSLPAKQPQPAFPFAQASADVQQVTNPRPIAA
jgi:hypothetical protein